MQDPFVAVVSNDMLKGKRTVSKEELYQYTYVSINDKILDSYFDKNKFENVLEFESVDNVSVLYVIQHGLGFSILPQLMTTKKINGIKTLRLKEPICRIIGFAYKKILNEADVKIADKDSFKRMVKGRWYTEIIGRGTNIYELSAKQKVIAYMDRDNSNKFIKPDRIANFANNTGKHKVTFELGDKNTSVAKKQYCSL